MSGVIKSDEKEDDEFEDEVFLGNDWGCTEGEKNLEATVKAICERAESTAASANDPPLEPVATDKFLRNFLCQMGMTKTLDCFQTEWAEMVHEGQVDAEQVGQVPDVYIKNQQLEGELKNKLREREEYQLAASTAAETLDGIRRARDAHRIKHNRVMQEKKRLQEETRKLKDQFINNEAALKRMTEKYQAALRQSTRVTMERDKVLGQGTQPCKAPFPQPRLAEASCRSPRRKTCSDPSVV